MHSILFVYTSANRTLTGKQTGWYLPEAAHPYYVLAPHASIDFAAPAGPNPPLDEGSAKAFKDELSVRFLKDDIVRQKLAKAKRLADVRVEDYDVIFYIGGHGPTIDLPFDASNAKLASAFWSANKIVAAVCHGPAALVQAVDATGKSIFAGRAFTGFSNAEEQSAQAVQDVPFLLEDKITALGGRFEKADALYAAKVVVDGKLITGQNPASATGVGEAILKALKA